MSPITKSYLTDIASQKNIQIQNIMKRIICKNLIANGYHVHHQIHRILQIFMSWNKNNCTIKQLIFIAMASKRKLWKFSLDANNRFNVTIPSQANNKRNLFQY